MRSIPALPAPVTNRTHCIAWSDYVTQPQVELAHGIRFDTNYYYWPADWVQDRPGLFTGSGMPDALRRPRRPMIDVYQAPTQMTDESGQTYPFTVDTLLDRALGPLGYYGVFTANMHTDCRHRAAVGRDRALGAGARRAGRVGEADARLARRPQRVVVRHDRVRPAARSPSRSPPAPRRTA